MAVWFESKPVRLEIELELMRRHHPQARLLLRNKKLIVFKRVRGRQQVYTFRIEFADDHPYSCPRAYAIEPETVRGTPHNIPSHSNRLCLFPPSMAGPHLSGKVILDWVEAWTMDYEQYRETGRWPERHRDASDPK